MAADCRQAVALARDHAPALACAILDLTTTRAEGGVIVRLLGEANADCPVVLMGTDPGALAAAGRLAGARGVLAKPFDLYEFSALLARQVRRSGR